MINIIPYKFRKPKYLSELDPNKIDSIAIHNTGASNTIDSDTNYHIDDRKWSWLGYGYYIDYDGLTHEVRGYKYINAGVESHNNHVLSIALRGNFDKTKPTQRQLDSLIALIEKLKSELPNIKYVRGHNFWNKKRVAQVIYSLLKNLRMEE